MTGFKADFVTSVDKKAWRPLFDGYAAFYKTEMNDRIADAVWSWLLDPQHVMEGLLLRDADEHAVGLLHFRACPRPLSGRDMCFVDDMFIAPDVRGSGAADVLVQRIGAIAIERDWPVVRWVTQHYNERGRGLYDRYTSGPTDFIMYQWTPTTDRNDS